AVPINFRLVGPEIQYVAQDSEARALVVQDALVERVEPIRDSLDISPSRFIHIGAQTPPAGWSAYETLIERGASTDPGMAVRPEVPWTMMYTSGTTGRPKGAVRSHAASALLSLLTALDMGFSADDTALLVMPMSHAN